MMKRTIFAITLIALLVLANFSFAQTYMPDKLGRKLTYVDMNAKGHILQGFRYEITDVKDEEGKTSIFFDVVCLNEKLE